MKKIVISLAVLAFATPAMAQGTTFVELDADQNGELSFEEVTAAVPELTIEQFAEVDTDASGSLTEEEFAVLAESMAS